MPTAKNKKSAKSHQARPRRSSPPRPLAICLGGVRDGDLVPANPNFPPPAPGYTYQLFTHDDGSVVSAWLAAGVTMQQAAGFLGEAFAMDGGLVEKVIRKRGI